MACIFSCCASAKVSPSPQIDPFSSISNNIFIKILEWLASPVQITQLSCVDRKWKQQSRSEAIWKKVYEYTIGLPSPLAPRETLLGLRANGKVTAQPSCSLATPFHVADHHVLIEARGVQRFVRDLLTCEVLTTWEYPDSFKMATQGRMLNRKAFVEVDEDGAVYVSRRPSAPKLQQSWEMAVLKPKQPPKLVGEMRCDFHEDGTLVFGSTKGKKITFWDINTKQHIVEDCAFNGLTKLVLVQPTIAFVLDSKNKLSACTFPYTPMPIRDPGFSERDTVWMKRHLEFCYFVSMGDPKKRKLLIWPCNAKKWSERTIALPANILSVAVQGYVMAVHHQQDSINRFTFISLVTLKQISDYAMFAKPDVLLSLSGDYFYTVSGKKLGRYRIDYLPPNANSKDKKENSDPVASLKPQGMDMSRAVVYEVPPYAFLSSSSVKEPL